MTEASPLSGVSLHNENKFQYESKKRQNPIGTKPMEYPLTSSDSHVQTERKNVTLDLFVRILKDKDTCDKLFKTDHALFRELLEYVIDSK